MLPTALVGLLLTSAFAALPSPLSSIGDCSLFGWNTQRLLRVGSFEMIPQADGCSARLEIRPEDPQLGGGWRAELGDPFRPEMGATVEYNFASFIPSSLKATPFKNVMIAQWHDQKRPGETFQRAPLMLRLTPTELLITRWNSKTWRADDESSGEVLFRSPIPWDRWLRFRFRVRWLDGVKGRVQTWLDGQEIVDVRGPIGYEKDPSGPYFKFGLYTVHPFEGTLSIEHRDHHRKVINEKD